MAIMKVGVFILSFFILELRQIEVRRENKVEGPNKVLEL